MKTKSILLTSSVLLFLICTTECQEDNIYYHGKVISLNNSNGCYNVIEISKTIPQGLPVNSSISFNPSLYNGQLETGETVYFKVSKYENWSGISLDLCITPQYVGELVFINK
jgi:hypothetical protein